MQNEDGDRVPSVPEPKFARKTFISTNRGFRMQVENPMMRFDELKHDDMLTIEDLRHYFRCSTRSIFRWVKERNLKPDAWYRQKMLFFKGTIMYWERAQRPKRGRPRKVSPGTQRNR